MADTTTPAALAAIPDGHPHADALESLSGAIYEADREADYFRSIAGSVTAGSAPSNRLTAHARRFATSAAALRVSYAALLALA